MKINCFPVLIAALALAALPSRANPTGAQVTAGQASVKSTGSTLTVTQGSSVAIINWQTFSIASGEVTKFLQPSSGSAVLNRVLTANPSSIYGSLQGNGQVYLINPSGIVIGPGGEVNTQSFIASTQDLSDQQFLNGGNLHFSGKSTAGVQNFGSIKAVDGNVYLIGQTVDNEGSITAAKGSVGLAAGTSVLLAQDGNEHVFVQAVATAPGTPATGVHNHGTISAASAELKAAGGNIYALAINNDGIVQATGLSRHDGHIYLSAAGAIQNSGKLIAKSGLNGGTVQVASTSFADSGTVDVTGQRHGGQIEIKTTHDISIAAGAALNASSTGKGDGGQVVIKSAGTTLFAGAIASQGGVSGGNGGLVEVSGLGGLIFTGSVNTLAPLGHKGTLLLDPQYITITSGADSADGLNFTDNPAGTLLISPDQLAGLLAGSDVVLQANDDITLDFNSDLVVSAPGGIAGSLTLQAGRSIFLNSNITTGNGNLTLIANDTAADGVVDAYRDPGAAVITMAPGTSINAGSGNVSIQMLDGAGNTNTDSGDITLTGITANSLYTSNPAPTMGTGIILQNDLTVADSMEFNGPVQLDGAQTLTAAQVTFDSSVDGFTDAYGNLFSPSLVINGTTTIYGAVGDQVPLGGLLINGTSIVANDVNCTGPIEFNGAVQLTGATQTFTGSTITFDSSVDGFIDAYGNLFSPSLVVNGSTTIYGAGGDQVPLGSLLVNGTSIVANDVNSTGSIEFNGAVQLTGATQTFTGSTITFDSSVDGFTDAYGNLFSPSLVINGTTTIYGAVGDQVPLGGLLINGTSIVANDVICTGSIEFNGAVQLTGATQTFTGSTITFDSSVDGITDAYGNLFSPSLAVNGTTTIYGAVGDQVPLGSLLVNGTSIVANDVNCTGPIEFNGAVQLTGATQTFTGSTITFDSSVDGFTDAYGNLFSPSLVINGSTTIYGAVGDQVPVGSLLVNGTSIVANDVNSTGLIEFNGTVQLTAATGATQTFTSSQVTFDSTVDGVIDSAGNQDSPTLTISGSATFQGAVGNQVPLGGLNVSGSTVEVNAPILLISGLTTTGTGDGGSQPPGIILPIYWGWGWGDGGTTGIFWNGSGTLQQGGYPIYLSDTGIINLDGGFIGLAGSDNNTGVLGLAGPVALSSQGGGIQVLTSSLASLPIADILTSNQQAQLSQFTASNANFPAENDTTLHQPKYFSVPNSPVNQPLAQPHPMPAYLGQHVLARASSLELFGNQGLTR